MSRDRPMPSLYAPLVNEHNICDPSDLDLTVQKATAKLCIKHVLSKDPNASVYIFTTLPRKWDFVQEDTICVIDVERQDMSEALMSVLETIQPSFYTGQLCILTDQFCSEISVMCSPFHMRIQKYKEIGLIELCSEGLLTQDSIGLEYIYGRSWVITSPNWEFVNIWEFLMKNNLLLVCSSAFDTDELEDVFLPVFYGLFPNSAEPKFLLKKIMNKEMVSGDPPVCGDICLNDSPALNALVGQYTASEYRPSLLVSGLHQYIVEHGLQGKDVGFPSAKHSLEQDRKKVKHKGKRNNVK